jgi:cobalt-zinc-cadmium efflux system protein
MTRDHDHTREHPPHSHARGHVHAPTSFGRAFAVGIILNTLFVLIEAGFGIIANSIALVADAGHNLSDVLGLIVVWAAAELARRPPSSRYTYGLRSSSILAALFNAVFLLITVGAIGWEAVLRLVHPESVVGTTMIVVAAIGIAVNGVTAWLFAKGRRADLNIRGAYIHMAADATVSVGVVAAGLLILVTGWLWLDPGQYHHCRRYCGWDMGAAMGQLVHVARCGAARHYARDRAKFPCRAARRYRGA